MMLRELLAQAIADHDAICLELVEDREVTRDDVRAVAAAKAIRQRSPVRKDVLVAIDDVVQSEYGTTYEVTIHVDSDGGDWSGRKISAEIPMTIHLSSYMELTIDPDYDRIDECVLRATGRDGEDQAIDLPAFGSWLMRASGRGLLREWLMHYGMKTLTESWQPTA